MARKLTKAERKVCEQFEALLLALEVDGVNSLTVSRAGAIFVHGHNCHISRFDGSLADRIEHGLEVHAENEPNEETARQRRIDELRRELANLEQAA